MKGIGETKTATYMKRANTAISARIPFSNQDEPI